MTSTCWHDDSQDGSSEWIFLKYFLNTKTTQGMKLQFLAEANCCYIPNELAGGDYRSAQRPHFSDIICLNTVWQIWTTLKETGHTYKEGECVFKTAKCEANSPWTSNTSLHSGAECIQTAGMNPPSWLRCFPCFQPLCKLSDLLTQQRNMWLFQRLKVIVRGHDLNIWMDISYLLHKKHLRDSSFSFSWG